MRVLVLRILLALLIVFVGFASADDVRRKLMIRGVQFPENLIILIDNSSSMDCKIGEDTPTKYVLACRAAMEVVHQSTDGMRVKVGVFGHSLKWDSQGWIPLPDGTALDNVAFFFACNAPDRGNTALAEAVCDTLKTDVNPLGILIITDGEPDNGVESTVTKIAIANEARILRGGEAAVIGVLVVGDSETGDKFGVLTTKIANARDSAGTYMQYTYKKPKATLK